MIFGLLFARVESFRHSDVAAGPVVPDAAAISRSADAEAYFHASGGVRYQLFRALRAMDKGEAMVVERRVPDAARHVGNVRSREAWFRSLRPAEAWRGAGDIIPLLVPGTAFPRVIGSIVISHGWCAPSEDPHWVPNLRFFLLTDAGHETFRLASDWWDQLSPLERARAMLLE